MARKMEELAYEAANKIYAKEDAGPYDCLRYAVRGYGVGGGLGVWLVQSVSEGLGQ